MELKEVDFDSMKANELREWITNNNKELPLYDTDDLDFLEGLDSEELLEICIDIYNYRISEKKTIKKMEKQEKELTAEQEDLILEAGRERDYEHKKEDTK